MDKCDDEEEKSAILCGSNQNQIRTASAIFWIYLGQFRDNGLKNILFRNKTFLFFKIERNFQHLFDEEFREISENYSSFRQYSDIVNLLGLKIVLMS